LVRQVRGEKRRLEILEGTLRLIARGGVAAVTHRLVATEAGVPLSATTYYFKSKTDLLTEAFRYHEERLASHETKATPPAIEPGPATCPIERAIESIIGLISQDMMEGRDQLVTEFELDLEATRRPELREFRRTAQERLVSWLTEAMQELGSTDPKSDSLALMFLLSGLELHALSRGLSSLEPRQRTAIARAMRGLLMAREPVRPREMKRRPARADPSGGGGEEDSSAAAANESAAG